MTKNMGPADRLIRTLIAIVWAILIFSETVSGTLVVILGLSAIVFLLTCTVRFCPLDVPLKISTKKKSG